MERVVRTFSSHEEAANADREYYRSLTPEQRLDILLELIEQGGGGTQSRFERVYRVIERKPR